MECGVLGLASSESPERYAEALLERAHSQLRHVAYTTTAVLRDGQLAASRRLPDELDQHLTALRLDASSLLGRLPEQDVDGRRKAEEMLESIDGALANVEVGSGDARPDVLCRLGLETAIDFECARLRRRAGLECGVEMGENVTPMDDSVATAAFRILQVLLTDVARDATATSARVRLFRQNGTLLLSVDDDGSGIKEARAAGLDRVRERASRLGGEVAFRELPGVGTSVGVRIPVAACQVGPGARMSEQGEAS